MQDTCSLWFDWFCLGRVFACRGSGYSISLIFCWRRLNWIFDWFCCLLVLCRIGISDSFSVFPCFVVQETLNMRLEQLKHIVDCIDCLCLLQCFQMNIFESPCVVVIIESCHVNFIDGGRRHLYEPFHKTLYICRWWVEGHVICLVGRRVQLPSLIASI